MKEQFNENELTVLIWVSVITVGVLAFGYQQDADVDSHNIFNGFASSQNSLELTIKDVRMYHTVYK